MTYVPIPYPAWRYSKGGSRIVKDETEDAALGAGWFAHPSQIDAAPAAPAPPKNDRDFEYAPPDVKPRDILAEFHGERVDDLLPDIAKIDDMELIAQLLEVEAAHPQYKGGRARVVRALNTRFEELQTAMLKGKSE